MERQDNIIDKNSKENYTKEGFILPNHYMSGKYQMIDIVEDQLDSTEFKGFNKFYVLKYLLRVNSPEEPLESKIRAYKKASYYLNEIISTYTKAEVEESIESPKYKRHNLEVVDIIEDQLSKDEIIGAYTGTILKYILRADKKEGERDYRKAMWFLNRLIKYCEAHNETK